MIGDDAVPLRATGIDPAVTPLYPKPFLPTAIDTKLLENAVGNSTI